MPLTLIIACKLLLAIKEQFLITSLETQMGQSCRILVLGSMPGAASLRALEYYAHRQNLFWDCVFAAYNIARDLPYDARVNHLNAHGVGLWDVLASCDRHASADATIKNAQANDFCHLFRHYPALMRVCLNGTAAARYWQKLVVPSLILGGMSQQLTDTQIIPLPSTSAANAVMTRADKLQKWQAAICV